METKKQIRDFSLSMRNSLSIEESANKSILAANIIINWDKYLSSKKIMIFSSFRSEIDTLPVIKDILSSGKELYIPVCIKSTSEIVAAKIKSLDQLSLNSYGILEPLSNDIFLGN